MLTFCFLLASLAFVMSSRDMRLCPGVSDRKCGVYMSPVQIDTHPTCARCRGRNCKSDSTCSTCEGWSLGQWESFNKKQSYAGCKKSSKRHAGDHTRLGLTATILTPTRGPTIGVREARVAPILPLPSPNAFKAERARERGQVTTHGQRNHGRGTSVPILSPPDRTDILLSLTPLARLGGSPAALSRSPRLHLQPSQWQGMEQASFYQGAPRSHGNARSPMTHYCSHMLTFTRIGNKAAPTSARGRGNPRHTPRIPLFADRAGVPTATTSPGRCTSARTPHTPVPGAPPRALPLRGTSQPSPNRASTGAHIIGTIRRQPGTVAASSLGAQQRLRPGDLYRLALHGQPPTVSNPSASDSSGAGADLSDRLPRSDKEASATIARLLITPARDARPATPRTGRLRRRLQSPKMRTHPPPPPPTHTRRRPVNPSTLIRQCVHRTPRTLSRSAAAHPLPA